MPAEAGIVERGRQLHQGLLHRPGDRSPGSTTRASRTATCAGCASSAPAPRPATRCGSASARSARSAPPASPPRSGPIALAILRREAEPGRPSSRSATTAHRRGRRAAVRDGRVSSRGQGARRRAPGRRQPAARRPRAEVDEPVPEMPAERRSGAGAEELTDTSDAVRPDADDSPARPRPRRRRAASLPRPARAAAGQRRGALARRLGALGAARLRCSSRCSTSTTATGSGSRPRGSRTSPRRAARCSSPTTPARCRRTRR